jgi:biofilm PGA synthesis lipoprotein PgaB
MRPFLLALLLLCLANIAHATAPLAAKPAFIVLAYHDVRDDVGAQGDHDSDATSTDHLIAQFDWLKANGYHVVSLDAVIKASQGGPALPDHAVLLTFDDGLESFYTRVYPLLRAYDYPAVSALVGSGIDLPAGIRCDRFSNRVWSNSSRIPGNCIRAYRAIRRATRCLR